MSGEHHMLRDARDDVQLEYARSLRRAGADLIMTYDAQRLALAARRSEAALR